MSNFNLKVYKKRFFLPDKLIFTGNIWESEIGGEVKLSLISKNAKYVEHFYLVNCCTLKNPQLFTRLHTIIIRECPFNAFRIVFE